LTQADKEFELIQIEGSLLLREGRRGEGRVGERERIGERERGGREKGREGEEG